MPGFHPTILHGINAGFSAGRPGYSNTYPPLSSEYRGIHTSGHFMVLDNRNQVQREVEYLTNISSAHSRVARQTSQKTGLRLESVSRLDLITKLNLRSDKPSGVLYSRMYL